MYFKCITFFTRVIWSSFCAWLVLFANMLACSSKIVVNTAQFGFCCTGFNCQYLEETFLYLFSFSYFQHSMLCILLWFLLSASSIFCIFHFYFLIVPLPFVSCLLFDFSTPPLLPVPLFCREESFYCTVPITPIKREVSGLDHLDEVSRVMKVDWTRLSRDACVFKG